MAFALLLNLIFIETLLVIPERGLFVRRIWVWRTLKTPLKAVIKMGKYFWPSLREDFLTRSEGFSCANIIFLH